MSTVVSYKGSTLATISSSTKKLLTAGKYLEDDITITDSGGGGITPTGTKQITITSNGTTTTDVTTYASVEVTANVPNTYAAGDEGKVVSGGALVSQTSDTVTQNGTVDTTLINSLTVNVSGGGGSGIWQDQDGYIHVSTQQGSSGISLVSNYLVVSTT